MSTRWHAAVAAPPRCRSICPGLLDKMFNRVINPGKVFDLELSLGQAADAYAAMDERRAIKALLRPLTSA